MLGWLSERTRMAKLAGLWMDATRLDPGDGGQIATMASGLIKTANMRTEDAWLTSLGNWAFNHPDPEAQFILASGLVRFLDIYGHSAGLSPECRNATREIAVELAAATAIFNPAIRLAGERFAEKERLETSEEQRRLEAKRIEKQLRNAELLSRARHSGNRQSERPTESKPKNTAGLISKAEVYTHAIEFLSLQLCDEGFAIKWMGESRGDIPSLIIEKGTIIFHVLLHVDIWPARTTPAPFVLERFQQEATAAGAYLRYAGLIALNRRAKQSGEKSEITAANIGFSFDGLQSLGA